MKAYLAVTVDSELYRKIECLRGREKRSTFVEHLLRLGIREHKRVLEEKQDRGGEERSSVLSAQTQNPLSTRLRRL